MFVLCWTCRTSEGQSVLKLFKTSWVQKTGEAICHGNYFETPWNLTFLWRAFTYAELFLFPMTTFQAMSSSIRSVRLFMAGSGHKSYFTFIHGYITLISSAAPYGWLKWAETRTQFDWEPQLDITKFVILSFTEPCAVLLVLFCKLLLTSSITLLLCSRTCNISISQVSVLCFLKLWPY
jgi:hypothetical protein